MTLRRLLLLWSCLLVAGVAGGQDTGVQLPSGVYGHGAMAIGNDGEYLTGSMDDAGPYSRCARCDPPRRTSTQTP